MSFLRGGLSQIIRFERHTMICAAMLSTVMVYGAGHRCRGTLSMKTVSQGDLQFMGVGRGERVTADGGIAFRVLEI
jgi:hypothetical protein